MRKNYAGLGRKTDFSIRVNVGRRAEGRSQGNSSRPLCYGFEGFTVTLRAK
jgi:hypothetical protein